MMQRKKKLKIIQISLLFLGIIIIFYTYFVKERENLTQENLKSKINNEILSQDADKDVFINVQYSGLDLNGNRYIIKSEKAFNNDENPNIVNMENVTSFFYFKDETTLKIISDTAIYNNNSLDMKFDGNIKATYMESRLFAQKAIYNNKDSSLIVTDNVKVFDSRGAINADKLFFDIKKQKLNISSLNKKKINANINLK
jgi:LPS export ABC transporter protein LptC